MLDNGIIVPALSALSFAVLISTKNDRKPRFSRQLFFFEYDNKTGYMTAFENKRNI